MLGSFQQAIYWLGKQLLYIFKCTVKTYIYTHKYIYIFISYLYYKQF